MKVLVTGGTGLVGSAIRKVVDNSDDYVFVSSKHADLRNPLAITQLFARYAPTHVIHLAARVGGIFANMRNNLGFFQDNLQMNMNVVRACHEFKVERAIFCLSTCIFPANAQLPLTESQLHDGPPHSSNEGYAYSKRMLECMVRYYRKAYGYQGWQCIVPTNIYGPHDNFDVETGHVIPSLIHRCFLANNASSGKFSVAGSGAPLRQFIYSIDLAKLIVQLIASGRCVRDEDLCVICCDSKSERAISEIADMIAAEMGFVGTIEFDTSQADGIERKTADNSKLLSLIGQDFAFTTLHDGIRETCGWFRSAVSSGDVTRL